MQRLGRAAQVGAQLRPAPAGTAGNAAGRPRRRRPRPHRPGGRRPPRRARPRRRPRRPLGEPREQPRQDQVGVARAATRRPRPAPGGARDAAGPSAPSRSPAQVIAQAWTTSSRSPSPLSGSQGSSRAARPGDRFGGQLAGRGPGRRAGAAVWASSACCWAESSSICHWSPGSGSAAATSCPRSGVRDGELLAGRGRRAPATASGGPGAAPGVHVPRAAPRVSRLASTAISIALSKWSAPTCTWARIGRGSAVSADGGHLSSSSRAAATSSAAAPGAPSSTARRAAKACRQAPQHGSVGAARTPARRRGGRGTASGVLAVAERRGAARGPPRLGDRIVPGEQTSRAAGHASLQSQRRPAGGRVCRVTMAASPGADSCSTPPALPSSDARDASQHRLRRGSPISGPRVPSPRRRSGARCLLGGSRAVPQPSVAAALAAVRSGDADAALVPLENSVEGSVPGDDGRSGRRRSAGDHPRGVPRRSRSSSPSGPGTTLADVRSVGSHPHALAQMRRAAGRATCPR